MKNYGRYGILITITNLTLDQKNIHRTEPRSVSAEWDCIGPCGGWLTDKFSGGNQHLWKKEGRKRAGVDGADNELQLDGTFKLELFKENVIKRLLRAIDSM